MPCIGQVSFLRLSPNIRSRKERRCVNALYRASLISTYWSTGSEGWSINIVSMPCIGQVSFLLFLYTDHNGQKGTLCQCPVSGKSHFYRLQHQLLKKQKNCVNALYRASLISTPPLRKPSIYAGSRACFCRYFSEYSENKPKQGAKVGRRLIVFFQIQFLKVNLCFYYTQS